MHHAWSVPYGVLCLLLLICYSSFSCVYSNSNRTCILYFTASIYNICLIKWRYKCMHVYMLVCVHVVRMCTSYMYIYIYIYPAYIYDSTINALIYNMANIHTYILIYWHKYTLIHISQHAQICQTAVAELPSSWGLLPGTLD